MDLTKLSDADLNELKKGIIAQQKGDLKNVSDRALSLMKEYYSTQVEKEKPNYPAQIETGARSFLEGQTAGISEPMVSAGKALGKEAINTATGNQGLLDKFKGLASLYPPVLLSNILASKAGVPYADTQTLDKLKAGYQADVAERGNLKKEFPITSIAGEVAGTIVPSPINVGTKIFQAASLPLSGVKALQTGQGFIKQGIKGAAEGALGSAGFETTKQLAERPTGFIKSEEGPVKDILESAMFGGIIGGGVGSLMALPKSAKESGLTVLSVNTGVSKENLKLYLKNYEAVNSAPSMEDLYNKVYNVTSKIGDDLLQKKITVEDSKDALKELTKNIKYNLEQKGLDAQASVKEADQILKASADKAREFTGYNIVTDIEKIKNLVIRNSNKAYEVLDASKKKFPTKLLTEKIEDQLDKLKIAGQTIGGKNVEAEAALNLLLNQTSGLRSKITMPELKKIIQSLDKDINWGGSAGSFSDPSTASKKAIRSFLDDYLKDTKTGIPDYALAMKPVAVQSGLLSLLNKSFGTEKAAIGGLKQINNPEAAPNLELLKQLSKLTGKDYVGSIRPQSLAEYPDLLKAKSALEALKKPGVREATIAEQVAASKEAATLAEAQKALATAKEAAKPFERIIPKANDRSSIEAALRSGINERSIEDAAMFKALSKKTDYDFEKGINDLRTKEAFYKTDKAGSKNVNFWGATLGILGTGLGMGPVPGIIAGVATGKFMDYFGPSVAKYVLDKTIAIGKLPGVKQINEWEIPIAAKKYLIGQLPLTASAITENNNNNNTAASAMQRKLGAK